LFTGPAKTKSDLELIIQNSSKIILNIDSFSELDKIGFLSEKYKTNIVCGVRISTSEHGNWDKFGIPLKELNNFWKTAKKFKYIKLQGIQTHISMNKDSKPYTAILKKIGDYLKDNFSDKQKKEVAFLDFGGGFLPHNAEGYLPSYTPKGKILSILDEQFNQKTKYQEKYYIYEADPLEKYAKDISYAVKKYIKPIIDCEFFCEPGRVISHESMHIALRIEDVKKKDLVITDGATNMIGWEKFEEDYMPLINITHPSLKELPCTVYGSLCTPHDIWGYYVYAAEIAEGDVLIIPNQGDYVYAYAQEFIKGIPAVYPLE
jgi:diaminopimelate decarboxylase